MPVSPLIVVKSTSSYTSEFIGSTLDPCMSKGYLNTSPDIYVTGNCFYFDYSGSKNSSDLKFLKKFFDNLSIGNTFNFSSGNYFIPETGSQTTWSGQFTLRGKTGSYNEYLNFSGLTGVSSLTGPNYLSTHFIAPIQFTATSGVTAQFLKNHLPKDDPFNFEYMGVYGSDYGYEEYVQVDASTLNSGRLLIKNSIKLNDSSEIIYIDPSANSVTSESLFFTKATIDALQRGDPSPNIRNTNKNANGIIIVNGETKNIILDKQNRFQQYCRQVEDTENLYTWYSNFNLKNIKTTSEPFITNGMSVNYTSFYAFKYLQNIGYSYNTTGAATTTLKASQYEDFIYVDDILVNTLNIPYSSNPGALRLDLSHAANIGTILEFYLDSQFTTPLSNNYYFIGEPGYEGSSFIYLAGNQNASRTIFIKCTRTSTKYLTINFV